MKTFVVSYWYRGDQWSLELPADDIDDARDRLLCIGDGTIDGTLVSKVPASVGWIVRAAVFVRNRWRALKEASE